MYISFRNLCNQILYRINIDGEKNYVLHLVINTIVYTIPNHVLHDGGIDKQNLS